MDHVSSRPGAMAVLRRPAPLARDNIYIVLHVATQYFFWTKYELYTTIIGQKTGLYSADQKSCTLILWDSVTPWLAKVTKLMFGAQNDY